SNRARAASAESNTLKNSRRVDPAYPFRMGAMARPPSHTSLAPHNFGRGMTASARMPMLSRMFTPTLCDYDRGGASRFRAERTDTSEWWRDPRHRIHLFGPPECALISPCPGPPRGHDALRGAYSSATASRCPKREVVK